MSKAKELKAEKLRVYLARADRPCPGPVEGEPCGGLAKVGVSKCAGCLAEDRQRASTCPGPAGGPVCGAPVTRGKVKCRKCKHVDLLSADRPCPGPMGGAACGRLADSRRTKCAICRGADRGRTDRPCPGFGEGPCGRIAPPRQTTCPECMKQYRRRYHARTDRLCAGAGDGIPCGKFCVAGQTRCRECSRDSYIRNRYGVSSAEYDSKLESQGGVCAICGLSPAANPSGRPFAIDHNHETGQVRGLLCDPCNHLLGNARESIPVLLHAIEYIEEWTPVPIAVPLVVHGESFDVLVPGAVGAVVRRSK